MPHSSHHVCTESRGILAVRQHRVAEDFSPHLPYCFLREEGKGLGYRIRRDTSTLEAQLTHEVDFAWGLVDKMCVGIKWHFLFYFGPFDQRVWEFASWAGGLLGGRAYHCWRYVWGDKFCGGHVELL